MIKRQDYYFKSEDGLKLYCLIHEPEQKLGPTVLCLPGLTRNSRDFSELAQHLSARYRVLTPDLRGRGLSDRDPHWQNYQAGTYLADIRTLLTSLGETRVAVIGTSLGALLGMVMGADRPQLVAGLVLNDAGPEIEAAGLARIAQYVGRQMPVQSWDEAVEQTRTTYEAALPGLSTADWEAYARRSYREDEQGRPVLDMDPMIGEAMRSGAAVGDLWPVFARLTDIPILVIRGAASDILSAATVARMAQLKPDLQHITVANLGHAPLLDEPECRVAIDAFLKSLQG